MKIYTLTLLLILFAITTHNLDLFLLNNLTFQGCPPVLALDFFANEFFCISFCLILVVLLHSNYNFQF